MWKTVKFLKVYSCSNTNEPGMGLNTFLVLSAVKYIYNIKN